MEKGQPFQQMVQEQLDVHMLKTHTPQNKTKFLKPSICTISVRYVKINSKCIIDLIVKHVKTKTSRRKHGETLCGLGLHKNLIDITLKTQSIKEKKS